MICPYIIHRVVVRQSESRFEDGNEAGWQQKEVNMARAMECPKEGCGAWKDGKCCYRGE